MIAPYSPSVVTTSPVFRSTDDMMKIDELIQENSDRIPVNLRETADELRFALSARSQVGEETLGLDERIAELKNTIMSTLS